MILLTGGAGFMGRSAAQALIAQGRAVRILDLQAWPDAPPEVEVIQGSIRNETATRLALRGVEGVIHLAAVSSLWTRRPQDYFAINAQAAGALAEQAKSVGVKRFLYVSSHTTLICGPPKLGVARLDESFDPPPQSLLGHYPRAKREGERLCFAQATRGFEVVCAIPTLPIGPGDNSLTAPTRLLLDLAKGRLPALLESSLNFVDVRDLAQSLIACLDRGAPGERYLLGGADIRLSALAHQVAQAVGRRPVRLEVSYEAALAAAYFEGGIAKVLGRPPGAPLTGVKLAARMFELDSAKAKHWLGHHVRPLEISIGDFLAWATSNHALRVRPRT